MADIRCYSDVTIIRERENNAMIFQCKRVYDPAERAMVIAYGRPPLAAPGGIKKTDLALDEWDQEITPSTELRKAFRRRSRRFATFREQYLQNWRNTSKKESGWRTWPNSR
ncbi:DUF488 family protein [Shigella flexneri]